MTEILSKVKNLINFSSIRELLLYLADHYKILRVLEYQSAEN